MHSCLVPERPYGSSQECMKSSQDIGEEEMEKEHRMEPVQFSLSHVRLFATPWTAACQASLSITNSQFTQTHVHWVGDAIQPSHPLSPPSPPTFSLSQHQGLFQWVNTSHEVAKVLEFQLQHQSFQWTPRADSFRMDWLDLLAVQGTLKSLLQHPSFRSINSSALSFLHSPTLTSIHDHWKNHSLD